jgi:hypothetical protein
MHTDIQRYHQRATTLTRRFEAVTFTYVSRAHNASANRMATYAIEHRPEGDYIERA